MLTAKQKRVVEKLNKNATIRRDDGAEGVVLTNGHWLVRVKRADWPVQLASTSGRNVGCGWESEAAIPNMDAVVPVKLGAEAEPSGLGKMKRMQMHGLRVDGGQGAAS